MLGGGGYYRGSTVLVSGTAGSGKSSLCAHFASATCQAGERALYISYEESSHQVERNMGVVGLDLGEWRRRQLLDFMALRATAHGFEAHLALVHKRVESFAPSAIILDPIGTFLAAGAQDEAWVMLVRLIDMLKERGMTIMLSSLTHASQALEQTSMAVSSMVDTWLLLKQLETNGERNRCLYVLKSRGMSHSNQVREFLITSHGIDLIEPYIGPEGVLTGTARTAQELRDRLALEARQSEDERQARLIERKRELLEQKIAALRAEFAADEVELQNLLTASTASQRAWSDQKERTRVARGAAQQRSPELGQVGVAPSMSRKRNGSAAPGRGAAKG
jgi:circadian clock protein KaiC